MVNDLVEQPLAPGDVIAYAIRDGGNAALRLAVVESASSWPIRVLIPASLTHVQGDEWSFSRRAKQLDGKSRIVKVSRSHLALALEDPAYDEESRARFACLIGIARSFG